jgi:hypothetical protein
MMKMQLELDHSEAAVLILHLTSSKPITSYLKFPASLLHV